jgi:dCMP deaminase
MLHAHLAATRSTCDRGPELLLDAGRHGVGAVLVREHRIIAGGYNGSPPGEPHCFELRCLGCDADWSGGFPEGTDERGFGKAEIQAGKCPKCGGELSGGHLIRGEHCVRTLHAEENALLQCALDGTTPAGATVYTTAGACWDCAKRFLRVRVARVVFAEPYDSRYGLSGDAMKILKRNGVQVERLDVREALGWK